MQTSWNLHWHSGPGAVLIALASLVVPIALGGIGFLLGRLVARGIARGAPPSQAPIVLGLVVGIVLGAWLSTRLGPALGDQGRIVDLYVRMDDASDVIVGTFRAGSGRYTRERRAAFALDGSGRVRQLGTGEFPWTATLTRHLTSDGPVFRDLHTGEVQPAPVSATASDWGIAAALGEARLSPPDGASGGGCPQEHAVVGASGPVSVHPPPVPGAESLVVRLFLQCAASASGARVTLSARALDGAVGWAADLTDLSDEDHAVAVYAPRITGGELEFFVASRDLALYRLRLDPRTGVRRSVVTIW
jgi:hypothetical protein